MSARPLDGVNVLDFCWVAVGPMTTKYLGEYGATVVRVESAKRPGTLRSAAPFRDGIVGINRSAYLRQLQRQQDGHYRRHAASPRPRADAPPCRVGPHRHRELHPRHHGGLGARLPPVERRQPRPGDVQRLHDGPRRTHGAPARFRAGTVIPGRPHQYHRLARPHPREPLWRLHRLHRPQVRRGCHPCGPRPQPPHRRGHPPGPVSA